LQFHQAGYQKLPEGEVQRINFDVRDRRTGERIAVTDSHAGNRVRVGDTDLFLEVDGIAPADRWRIYRASAPTDVYAAGLLTGGQQLRYSFKPLRFFTHFLIDETTRAPRNGSTGIVNPALEVALFLDGRQVETTWLFADRELADAVPVTHPRFRLELRDVRFRRDLSIDQIEWNEPDNALFEIALMEREAGAWREAGIERLTIGEESQAVEYTSVVDHGGEALLGTEGNYEVRILGPTDRYLTVLSVVHEPTVLYTNLGVLIIVIGAMMTFIFRYRALYGLWDEQTQTLRLALVPRWGQSPVQKEFDAIVAELSGGRGAIVKGALPNLPPEEDAPAHETVNPKLANA
jgi:hypothetical protein